MSAGSFDAGSILGHLGLDISEYGKGILEAQGFNELFPESIATFIENPLLGLADIAKETAEALVDFLGDAFKEVQADALEAGLAAERAGTSVQFMSEWSEVAKAAGVDAVSLSSGFKALQRSASDAAEQGGAMMKYWTELGISQQELQSHLGDSGALFMMVKDHLSEIANASDRASLAQHIFSRGGAELIPVLDMQNDAVQRIIDNATQMGAIETDESAKSARAVNELENTFQEAWTGMKMAAMEPILGFLADHSVEVEGVVTDAFAQINTAMKELFGISDSKGPQLMQMITDAADDLVIVADTLSIVRDSIEWILAKNNDMAGVIYNLNSLNFSGAGQYASQFFGLSPDSFGPSAAPITVQNTVNMNPNDTADAIAKKMLSGLQEAARKQKEQATAAAHRGQVAGIIRGNY